MALSPIFLIRFKLQKLLELGTYVLCKEGIERTHSPDVVLREAGFVGRAIRNKPNHELTCQWLCFRLSWDFLGLPGTVRFHCNPYIIDC